MTTDNTAHERSPLGQELAALNSTVYRDKNKRHKRSGNTFCGICYGALPRRLQNALYKQIGAGYMEAVEEATTYLRERGYIL